MSRILTPQQLSDFSLPDCFHKEQRIRIESVMEASEDFSDLIEGLSSCEKEFSLGTDAFLFVFMTKYVDFPLLESALDDKSLPKDKFDIELFNSLPISDFFHHSQVKAIYEKYSSSLGDQGITELFNKEKKLFNQQVIKLTRRVNKKLKTASSEKEKQRLHSIIQPYTNTNVTFLALSLYFLYKHVDDGYALPKENRDWNSYKDLLREIPRLPLCHPNPQPPTLPNAVNDSPPVSSTTATVTDVKRYRCDNKEHMKSLAKKLNVVLFKASKKTKTDKNIKYFYIAKNKEINGGYGLYYDGSTIRVKEKISLGPYTGEKIKIKTTSEGEEYFDEKNQPIELTESDQAYSYSDNSNFIVNSRKITSNMVTRIINHSFSSFSVEVEVVKGKIIFYIPKGAILRPGEILINYHEMYDYYALKKKGLYKIIPPRNTHLTLQEELSGIQSEQFGIITKHIHQLKSLGYTGKIFLQPETSYVKRYPILNADEHRNILDDQPYITELMLYSRMGDYKNVENLLQLKAVDDAIPFVDINCPDRNGQPALHHAINSFSGNPQSTVAIVNLLISNGAKVMIPDVDFKTELYHLIEDDDKKYLLREFLIDAKLENKEEKELKKESFFGKYFEELVNNESLSNSGYKEHVSRQNVFLLCIYKKDVKLLDTLLRAYRLARKGTKGPNPFINLLHYYDSSTGQYPFDTLFRQLNKDEKEKFSAVIVRYSPDFFSEEHENQHAPKKSKQNNRKRKQEGECSLDLATNPHVLFPCLKKQKIGHANTENPNQTSTATPRSNTINRGRRYGPMVLRRKS